MLDQRGHGCRSIGREAQLVALFQLDHERPQFQRRPEQPKEWRCVHIAREIVHPLQLGCVEAGASFEDVGSGVGNRGDLFVAIECRLVHLCENRVVVRHVRFVRIEQHAVRVKNYQLDHL